MAERSKTSDILSIYVPSFFIFLGMSIISPILPIYAKSFDVSFALASMAISMYAIGRLILDFPVGIIADNFGRRPLMIVGTLLMAVTAYLNATADNFWLFLFYRFLQGAGSAMWMTARTVLLADILKPEERGRVMSYFQSFMLIGSAAGPTIGGVVAEAWGITAPFYFYALTGFVSLVLTYVWVREPEFTRHSEHKGLGFPMDVVKRILVNRSFLMASIATFTSFFLMTGIRSTILPLYASDVVGLNTTEIGTVITCATIVNLFLTIPIGYALDLKGRKPVIVASIAVSGLACLTFPFASSFILLCLAALILGVGTSGAQQAPLAMATDATIHEPHGISMGIYRFFGDIGFVFGPVVLGLVADASGLATPFYVMAGIMLFNAALIFLFAEETLVRKKPRGEAGP